MELTPRLNVLRHSDLEARTRLLSEILGRPMPETLTIYPPSYCDYGLNLEFGERVFVNQNCAFYDLGSITIGDRTMIGPGVTLSTAGHPVEPHERFDGITTALIIIECNVWIGANATITPGVLRDTIRRISCNCVWSAHTGGAGRIVFTYVSSTSEVPALSFGRAVPRCGREAGRDSR